MEVRTFFTDRQMSEIGRRYETDTAYLESGKSKRIAPYPDFLKYRSVAMYAYLLGDNARAADYLRQAVAFGFPPNWTVDIKDDHDRQWKNYQDGSSAFVVGLAAHILGLKERRDEILSWSLQRLLDTDALTEGEDPQYSDVLLDRAYVLLAAGRYWPKMEADLALADHQISRATDNSCKQALPKTLAALVQAQKGNVSRQQATVSLTKLIRDSKRHALDRMEACFHAIYLQSAFPDVFDPVLPPFPTA